MSGLSRLSAVAAALVLTAACHGPVRPTPPEAPPWPTPDAATLSPDARAWLDWLGGRPPATPAPAATPLAALLCARGALDRSEPRVALDCAADAYRLAPPDSAIARLAWRWAQAAGRQVPDGAALLDARLGTVARPVEPAGARHTLRISFLSHLDAARLIQRPPRFTPGDAGRTIEALGNTWALADDPPRPDPDGLVISTYTLPAGAASVEIADGGRLLAFRGEKLALATPPDRPPPGTVRFSVEGAGPLVLVWSSSHLPAVRLWPFDTPPGLRPTDSTPTGPTIPVPEPLDRLLSALLALEDEDRETVETALAGAPGSNLPVVQMLRAEAAATDPSIPAGRTRDARRSAWEAMMPVLPLRARLELSKLARQGGDLDAAREFLDAAAVLAPESEAVAHAQFETYFGLGWNDDASAALDRAERAAARPCDLLDDRVALQGARGNTAGRLRLVQPLSGCGRTREAAELLMDLERPAEALSLLESLSGPAALDSRVQAAKRRALVALDRLDDAHAQALVEGKRAAATDAAPDLAAADLDKPGALETALRLVMRDHATSREAQELLLVDPASSLFGPLLQDTEAVIIAYEADLRASPDLYDGPAVQVLDHSATRYFSHGKRLRWVHEILAIRTREAAEEYGEVTLPEDARPVAVFNRKADGRRLYAEDDLTGGADKESLSLPDVAIGDYVVAIYIEPGDNGYLYDTGYLTPRIFLGGGREPVFKRIDEIVAPSSMPPGIQRLAGAPEPTKLTLPGPQETTVAGLRLVAERLPLLTPEEDSVPDGLVQPSARLGDGVRLADDLDFTRDRILARRQRGPELDAWAQDLAGEGEPFERAARLARAVRERIDGQTGLIADDAPRMWESGHGHRAMVLSVALEAAGIAHRLLLARPKTHVPSEPFTQVFDFPYALIEVLGTPEHPLSHLLDPGPDRAAPGFIPYGFLGGDALQVWPAGGPPTPISLPTTREVEDSRHIQLHVALAADGTLTGDVEDVLTGQEAIVIGGYLARLDAAARPKVMERLLVSVLGAGAVDRFEDPFAPTKTASPDGPLTLRYHFTAKAGKSLELGLFPVSPGRAWASRAERRTPMAIDLPTHQTLTVDFEGPDGLVTTAADADTHLGGHGFTRRITARGAGRWHIETSLDLAGGVVAPAEYPAFAEWAHAVDPLEKVDFTTGP